MTTPSGRKARVAEQERERNNAVNSGHYVHAQLSRLTIEARTNFKIMTHPCCSQLYDATLSKISSLDVIKHVM